MVAVVVISARQVISAKCYLHCFKIFLQWKHVLKISRAIQDC